MANLKVHLGAYDAPICFLFRNNKAHFRREFAKATLGEAALRQLRANSGQASATQVCTASAGRYGQRLHLRGAKAVHIKKARKKHRKSTQKHGGGMAKFYQKPVRDFGGLSARRSAFRKL